MQVHIHLVSGKLSAKVYSTGVLLLVLNITNYVVLNDNTWHGVDFLVHQKNKNTFEAIFEVDRDVGGNTISRNVFSSNSVTMTLASGLQFGGNHLSSDVTFEGCFDNLRVNSQLVDLFEFMQNYQTQLLCTFEKDTCESRCGEHGRCRNARSQTDMTICECEFGYMPQFNSNNSNQPIHKLACDRESVPKHTLGTSFSWQMKNKFPTKIQLSMRTEVPTFDVISIAAINLLLRVYNGQPELQVQNVHLYLQNINISDRNWHYYSLTFKKTLVELSLDGLDGAYYAAGILTQPLSIQNDVDVLLAKHAYNACLDDVTLEYGGSWKTMQRSYPMSERQDEALFSWSSTGLADGCSAIGEQCNLVPTPDNANNLVAQCPSSQICVDIWRGYICSCKENEVFSSTIFGICVPKNCEPNPCLNNGTCNRKTMRYTPTSTTNNSNLNSSVESTTFSPQSNSNWSKSAEIECTCNTNWTGVFCQEALVPEPFTNPNATKYADFTWLIIFLVLLFLFLILLVFLIWCCCRRRKIDKEKHNYFIQNVQEMEKPAAAIKDHSQQGAGEVDFNGPINFDLFYEKPKQKINKPAITQTNVNNAFTDAWLPNETNKLCLTPWNKLSQFPDHIKLDGTLDYGFEGFDYKSPNHLDPINETGWNKKLNDDDNLKSDEIAGIFASLQSN